MLSGILIMHFKHEMTRDKIMRKAHKKHLISITANTEKISVNILRKNRIETLKTMINNKDYVDEAIVKLANSLTSGLMK